MTYFSTVTPEQRKAMVEKSKVTRRAKKEAKQHEEARARLAEMAAMGSASAALRMERMEKIDNLVIDEPETDETPDEHFPEPEIVYGEVSKPAVVEPEAHESGPFELFMLSLDTETKTMLGADELREIYDAQVAKAFAEKRAARKRVAAESALAAARTEIGLVPLTTREVIETARRNAELVRFTVQLPPAGDQGEVPDIGLRIDQKIYLHGHTYTVTRAQYDSMRETLYRADEHELTFKGQNIRQRKWMLGRTLGSVERYIPATEDGGLA